MMHNQENKIGCIQQVIDNFIIVIQNQDHLHFSILIQSNDSFVRLLVPPSLRFLFMVEATLFDFVADSMSFCGIESKS